MTVTELRRYTLHPGRRDDLIELFEREFVTGQQEAGIAVGGRYRELDDPDRFVWLRAFPDMAARLAGLRTFYGGPVWQAHREQANATMRDSDDVLLLRGTLPPPPPTADVVTAVICHPADPGTFAAAVEQLVRPALGGRLLGTARTEHAVNDFPALPVRTGEDVFVWLTTAPAADAAAAVPPQHLLLREPQLLRLAPVRARHGGAGPDRQAG
ncbi:NIPSNAP family protein [Kitasatospora sp. NBC_01560]|uniref:NIPSNAP family protein n=1 Tax=Kitasatospora sp. NBC_01560 TaxID=2975965 RepID=UPI00386EE83B